MLLSTNTELLSVAGGIRKAVVMPIAAVRGVTGELELAGEDGEAGTLEPDARRERMENLRVVRCKSESPPAEGESRRKESLTGDKEMSS